jgi:hypothetical protein
MDPELSRCIMLDDSLSMGPEVGYSTGRWGGGAGWATWLAWLAWLAWLFWTPAGASSVGVTSSPRPVCSGLRLRNP